MWEEGRTFEGARDGDPIRGLARPEGLEPPTLRSEV